ncbi:MAG TPA: peptide chain release factor N(5)-glutamine methyltransferase [Gemmatimonadales bacterium]|nr:peptide chain release factor N(5)-glutamine methyltransferase [Gemmatimonadales bacterium]
MNVAELIETAARRLRDAGVVKPRREANRLWAWLNRVSPGESYLARERAADPERSRQFEAAVERRVAGEPLAYVLGHTGFRNLELRCDRRALIPRPESEGIIDHALRRVRTGRALDLGTGTGCLALALADEGEFAAVVAVDISPDALALARENSALTGRRVHLLLSDFGSALAPARFELIVSNPPYLAAAECAALDPSVREWEPPGALTSGEAGVEATRRVLSQAVELLVPGGWLVMELDSSRSEAGAEWARQLGFREVEVWNDLFGRARYLTARRD